MSDPNEMGDLEEVLARQKVATYMAHEMVLQAIIAEISEDDRTALWNRVCAIRRDMNILGEDDATFAQIGLDEIYKRLMVGQGAAVDGVLGRILGIHK